MKKVIWCNRFKCAFIKADTIEDKNIRVVILTPLFSAHQFPLQMSEDYFEKLARNNDLELMTYSNAEIKAKSLALIKMSTQY